MKMLLVVVIILLWLVLANSKIAGVCGNDMIIGGDGEDVLLGGIGDDLILGYHIVNDRQIVKKSNNIKRVRKNIVGVVKDDGSSDILIGGLGSDSLYGGKGNDLLVGY